MRQNSQGAEKPSRHGLRSSEKRLLIDDNDPLSRQQHYIFPILWGELLEGFEYNLGPGFGLTRGSDHVIMKVNLELERFVGAIFGTSPNSSWFH